MDVWPVNEPNTLEDTCINFLLENIFLYLDKTDDSYCLKPGISFPQGLSDKLLQKLITETKHLVKQEDNLFGIFNNRASTVLTNLPLRYTAVGPEELEYLCLHPVRELDITYCTHLKSKYVTAINQTAPSLRCLRLGGGDQIERLEFIQELCEKESPDCSGDNYKCNDNAIFTLPNLRSLTLRDIKMFKPADDVHIEQVPMLSRVIYHLKSLTCLDLCECQLERKTLESLGDLDLPHLVSLNLCDVLNGCEMALDNLCKLTNLRHLDISQGDETTMFLPVQYSSPSERLHNLVTSMPNLTSLDISGTNLAGFALIQPIPHKPEPFQRDQDITQEEGIPGSDGRQFDFIGLLNSSDDASHRKNLPAKRVTGDANEEQVLLAVHMYRDRPTLLTRALNYLYDRFRDDTVKAQCVALEGILAGMERNRHDLNVQICGSASLFYLVKGSCKHRITQSQKRRIINCVLEAMERHREVTMLRNGCLILCHFNIPQEVLYMYCYNRLVNVMLTTLRSGQEDHFLQRLCVFLLNSLACQVEGEAKRYLGDMGTIKVMCSIIYKRLTTDVCDEVMEVCWSTLWNVTDETESNCDKFIEERGMHLFLECYKKFPDKEELLRNMMGLMGNIAEVEKLRVTLMDRDYVTVFANLLESTKDGIEVSYNAAGVLAHMLSDGPSRWTFDLPNRDNVIFRMGRAIKRWPLDSKRNINYRSFGPILRLVRNYQCAASQRWAVWALCNLTHVYPEKYCELLRKEGGIEVLEEVMQSACPHLIEVSDLANQVVTFVRKWEHKPVVCDMDDLNEKMASNTDEQQ